MTSVEIPSNMAYGGHGQFVPSQPVIAAPALSWLDLAADRFDRWISPRIVYYHSITDPKTPLLTLFFESATIPTISLSITDPKIPILTLFFVSATLPSISLVILHIFF